MPCKRLATLIVAAAWLAACAPPDRGTGGATGTAPGDTVTVTTTETVTASPPAAASSPAVDPCRDELARFGFIFVTEPRPGYEVTSPFSVAGCSNTFEANVQWRLMGDGATLAKGFTTATCGSGCVGDFRFEVRFPSGPRRIARLEVFEISEADGSVRSLNAIPLVLGP